MDKEPSGGANRGLVTASRTVVIGGGISGLTVAWALRTQGAPVLLLEASDRLGGQIRSRHRDGFVLEDGPNGFLDRDGSVSRLATALGIGDKLRGPSPTGDRRAIFVRGRLRDLPASPPRFMMSGLLPPWSKARLMLEPLSKRGALGVDESLGHFGRRHLGRVATETLLDAMQTGIFAGDIEKLSVRAAFPRLHHMERSHRSLLLAVRALRRAHPGAGAPRLGTIEGGLQTLPDALARALGPDALTGAAAVALRPEEGGWSVQWSGGSASARRVVLATPPNVTAQLLESVDPSVATALRAIHVVPVTVVHLGWSPRLDREPEGFGFLVPAREHRRILGTIYASSAFPFRAPGGGTLLTTLVGGAHHPELAALPDAELVQAVREELQTMLGIHRAPDLVEVVRWPRAIPQYEVGHHARLEAIALTLRSRPGLLLAGNAYRGPGIADCVREGLVLADSIARMSGMHATV